MTSGSKTASNELKPDVEGFRYVLMWLSFHLDHNQDATRSYLLEWHDFIVDCQRELVVRNSYISGAQRLYKEKVDELAAAKAQLAALKDELVALNLAYESSMRAGTEKSRELAAAEEKRREDVRKCAAVAEGDYLAVNPYTGGRKDAAVMIRNAFPEVFP